MEIQTPLPGTVTPLSEVPDPVFAAGTVGFGAAIRPDENGDTVTVVSPVSGKLLRVMPHAFVVLAGKTGVLVHIGIDTVKLDGDGFTLHAAQGNAVNAGDPIVSFDPADIRAKGYDPICPVVVMDTKQDGMNILADGEVGIGTPLLEV